MFLIGGLLVLATAAAMFAKGWRLSGVESAPLGWMSEQWLAERRASHP
jgi:hypothetical protein